MQRFLVTAIILMSLLCPPWAQADQPCEVIPMPCTFEALPFKFKVVDAETHQPLADVHALAEWQMHGTGGRPNGPLMVLDAVSGPDGLLSFPGWGPLQGPWLGLVIGYAPVITLFNSRYKAMVVNNGYLPPARERERVWRFAQDGRTYTLDPFRGTPSEWAEELWRVGRPIAAPASDELLLRWA
jgi:hypothetical protein